MLDEDQQARLIEQIEAENAEDYEYDDDELRILEHQEQFYNSYEHNWDREIGDDYRRDEDNTLLRRVRGMGVSVINRNPRSREIHERGNYSDQVQNANMIRPTMTMEESLVRFIAVNNLNRWNLFSINQLGRWVDRQNPREADDAYDMVHGLLVEAQEFRARQNMTEEQIIERTAEVEANRARREAEEQWSVPNKYGKAHHESLRPQEVHTESMWKTIQQTQKDTNRQTKAVEDMKTRITNTESMLTSILSALHRIETSKQEPKFVIPTESVGKDFQQQPVKQELSSSQEVKKEEKQTSTKKLKEEDTNSKVKQNKSPLSRKQRKQENSSQKSAKATAGQKQEQKQRSAASSTLIQQESLLKHQQILIDSLSQQLRNINSPISSPTGSTVSQPLNKPVEHSSE